MGAIFIVFGAWGVILQEYNTEGYRWRNGLQLEGHQAVLIGVEVLFVGVYIIYLGFTEK